jgi:hypothetical protein
MSPPSLAYVWFVVLASDLACGGAGARSDADDGGASDGAPAALTGAPGVWTWIDIPGTTCDDGSPTGIAINPAPGGAAGGDLLVYFMGGGACWDASTCFVLNTSLHGPYGRGQWETTGVPFFAHQFDRSRATNPVRAASYVIVPYCTGDFHAGNNVTSYDVMGPRPFRHVGRLNVEAVLPRLRATWPAPARVVVAGTSAGGFGATLNYALFRDTYPGATMSLVNDAGPMLEGDGIPAAERAAWYANWHLGDVVDPLCAGCAADLSLMYPALTTRHPQDRMALLTSLQDEVVAAFFLISLAADMELRTRALIADRIAPSAAFRAFVIPGTSHGLLGAADTITSGGMTLETWLSRMVDGDPTWATVGL